MLFALGFIAAVAVLGLIVVMGRAQSESRRAQELLKERDTVQENLKALQSKEREHAKKLEERAQEIQSLKQDLAALRKKHHSAQEEAKKLRAEMKEQVEERDALLNTRPAFEPVVKAKPEPTAEAAAPQAAPKAKREDSKPVDVDARIAKLQEELAAAQAAIEEEKKAQKAQRDELRKQRYYAEQLRRIAVVSKSQVETLEDKVTSLGRQYYDAVSELAALKGEVVPPKPRPAEKTPKAVSAESLSAELDNAARDAGDTEADATHAP